MYLRERWLSVKKSYYSKEYIATRNHRFDSALKSLRVFKLGLSQSCNISCRAKLSAASR